MGSELRKIIIEAKEEFEDSFILCLLLKIFEVVCVLEMTEFAPNLFYVIVILMN